MWIRIRTVIIDEPAAAEHLTTLLDETCQVEVIGSAADSETGLNLCAELRPDAAVWELDIPQVWRVAVFMSQLPQWLSGLPLNRRARSGQWIFQLTVLPATRSSLIFSNSCGGPCRRRALLNDQETLVILYSQDGVQGYLQ